MAQNTQFVGVDLHKDSVALAVLPEGSSELLEFQELPNDPAKLRRFFQRVSKRGPVKACYEAGGCGYMLYRDLRAWGHECEVIAPNPAAPPRPSPSITCETAAAKSILWRLPEGREGHRRADEGDPPDAGRLPWRVELHDQAAACPAAAETVNVVPGRALRVIMTIFTTGGHP